MKKSLRIFLIAIGLLFAALAIMTVTGSLQDNDTASTVVAAEVELDGFQRASGPTALTFPQDFGPHPDYQTEWWYYTGNLETEDGQRFGYQLTFFRRALEPADLRVDRPSDWATDQLYLGHFAVSNIDANDYDSFERYARGAAGVAGAEIDPAYRVYLENWEAVTIEPGVRRLTAQAGDVSIDLIAEETKGPIFQGIEGYSQKGPEAGNASYYYSFTRMETTGTITANSETFEVEGLSWMDHEFSTSALSDGQVGWDWFSIQLDNNTELMLYYLRREDGSIDSFSKGNFIAEDGSTTNLSDDDYTITVTDTWRSAESGAEYPAGWEIEVDTGERSIFLIGEPQIADQEFDASFKYWEGSIRLEGTSDGEAVGGYGYVEMTGYFGSMEGRF